MNLEPEDLTGRIMAAAIEVHRTLGPGFLESVYGNALAVELQACGLAFQRKVNVPILHEDEEVGLHRVP